MGVTVSGGLPIPIGTPWSRYAPIQQRIEISPYLSLEYFEIWRLQPSVRRVVTFLARNIAQLSLGVYERESDTERAKLSDHPLAKLLGRPNPKMTPYRFKSTLIHDLAIYDNAYWRKIRVGGKLVGLQHLPPRLVTPNNYNTPGLSPTEFKLAGPIGGVDDTIIPAEDVFYLRGYGGIYDIGISPLESLRQTLREEWTASEMRDQIMRNGARMSGYLQRPREAPEWSTTARRKFKEAWRSQYSGPDASQAGGTPILEDGMEFKAASQTAKDLQYIEGRKLTDEEVCRSYFIPPPMVGILDKATFSNIQEQHVMLYQDTLGPLLEQVEDEIDLQLVPEIEPVEPERFYAEFNLREKLTGNFKDRAGIMQTAVGGPWLTINEARAMDNRPPVEGGDELIKPLNVTQNGDQNPIPADDQAPGDQADDEATDELDDDE
ncbi:phage portal protein [Mycobacteroides abscessus]|uniref:phage portal protein n=1 Tax=Mycobacteroides abscessus TaxID=36809 RepID=UPI0005DBA6D8|nr:phage portal protein [Mycobacteroides abscessus]CPR79297.1 phage portal protein%2C HK97 family [Mycobacteroides abscessus]CPR88450.1 phage portal protein%2C HK97 family [Mycobacteroides abscessus]CPS43389.1 phage portal protein%2C HK97 family [Mycobacteroides abscessus]CPV03178.1 phage portal protein%2C HK97 family [Mycobacteroides abscessus]